MTVLNVLQFDEIDVCDTRQKWIAIIEPAKPEDLDQGNGECTADPERGKIMSCRPQIYTQL